MSILIWEMTLINLHPSASGILLQYSQWLPKSAILHNRERSDAPEGRDNQFWQRLQVIGKGVHGPNDCGHDADRLAGIFPRAQRCFSRHRQTSLSRCETRRSYGFWQGHGQSIPWLLLPLPGRYAHYSTPSHVPKSFRLIQSGIFGLPGYFLKGIEQELLRRHLTMLQAEIFLIQLRRSSFELSKGTDAEKAKVIDKWKELVASIREHE